MAWAEVLERMFPGIGNQPHRVQGLVRLMPYRNPDPRQAVAALVDGRAYVMVDGSPDLLLVHSDHGYVLHGREVRVLSINSHKWRQYFMILVDGWMTPDTFSAAIRGDARPPDGGWWPADKEVVITQTPLAQRKWLHVAVWALAVLIIGCSATSVPTGSPHRQLIEALLVLAGIGLVITSVTGFFSRPRQGSS